MAVAKDNISAVAPEHISGQGVPKQARRVKLTVNWKMPHGRGQVASCQYTCEPGL